MVMPELGITGARWRRAALSSKYMTDAQARPGAPTDAPPSLSVDEAAQRYENAGVPRTIRRIQKYCARGDLECKKVETEFGERYVISSESIDRHISQIREALVAAGHAPARPDAAGRDYQTLFTEHLEKENAFLREQNTVLLERVKETNILTGRLQEMLSPLLGGPSEKGSERE